MLNLSLISPKGRGFCDSPPWEGAGEVVFLFPLRGNFVTLRGCKKCDKISLDFRTDKCGARANAEPSLFEFC